MLEEKPDDVLGFACTFFSDVSDQPRSESFSACYNAANSALYIPCASVFSSLFSVRTMNVALRDCWSVHPLSSYHHQPEKERTVMSHVGAIGFDMTLPAGYPKDT